MAREVINGEGYPTLKIEAQSAAGQKSESFVSSNGFLKNEIACYELKDKDKQYYDGRGVGDAIDLVNKLFVNKIIGVDSINLSEIDKRIEKLDKTENKRKIGANTMFGVSMAIARLGAKATGKSLFEHLRHFAPFSGPGWQLPLPIVTLLSGGHHTGNTFDLRSIGIIVNRREARGQSRNIRESVVIAAKIFHELGRVLKRHGFDPAVSSTGAYLVGIPEVETAFKLAQTAIIKAGFSPRRDVGLCVDVGAVPFYDELRHMTIVRIGNQYLSNEELTNLYRSWLRRYPIVIIQNPFSIEDEKAWSEGDKLLSQHTMLVGDDILGGNAELLKKMTNSRRFGGVAFQPIYAGTVSSAIQFAVKAKSLNLSRIVSASLEETPDDFIVDFAVALGAEYISIGGMSRGERVAKYNRLLELSDLLETN